MSVYEQMSIRELQEECRKRGLPTGRSKELLIDRLDVYESENGVNDNLYTCSFPINGQLDDEQHIEFRYRTYQAALKDGYEPQGGVFVAWRIESNDTHHVYGIWVKENDS